MKKALLLALSAFPLIACGGAVEGDRSPDEGVGTSESELANPSSYIINFDYDAAGNALADGTIIDTTYTSSFGVTFTGIKCTPSQGCVNGHAYARTSVGAESPPNVVSQDATSIPIFDAHFGAVRADFSGARTWVSIDVVPVITSADWIVPPTSQPWFEAYDASNNLVGQVYYPIAYGAAGWGTYQTLRIDAGSARIKWVRFSAQPPGTNTAEVFGEFDNMRFNSNFVKLCPYKFGC